MDGGHKKAALSAAFCSGLAVPVENRQVATLHFLGGDGHRVVGVQALQVFTRSQKSW